MKQYKPNAANEHLVDSFFLNISGDKLIKLRRVHMEAPWCATTHRTKNQQIKHLTFKDAFTSDVSDYKV